MNSQIAPVVQVFISYTQEGGDKDWVLRTLVPRLEGFGFGVFVDDRVRPTEDFSSKIPDAIRDSKYFLAVCTPEYKTRSSKPDCWVARELNILLDTHGGKIREDKNPRVVPLIRRGSVEESVPKCISSVKGIARLNDSVGDDAKLRDVLYTQASLEEMVGSYIGVLGRRLREVELPGRDAVDDRVSLEDVYISLDVQRFGDERAEGEEPLGEATEYLRRLTSKGSRTLLLGALGSGKSTVLKRLCLRYIREMVTAKGKEGLRNRILGKCQILPLFIHAIVLARAWRPTVRREDLLRDCIDIAISDELGSSALGNKKGEGILREYEIVLVVDGLDEVADEELIDRILGDLASAIDATKRVSLIIACRWQTLRGDVAVRSGFETLELKSLDSNQVRDFFDRRLRSAGGQTDSSRIDDYYTAFKNARDQHPWFEGAWIAA